MFRFTAAYNVQLVGMLAPFVTALVSRAATGEQLPRALWPALLVAVCGATLVVLQQSPLLRPPRADDDDGGGGGSGDDDATLGASDALGMALQLVTITMQAFVRVEMQRSRGKLSPRELLIVQYACATVPFVALTALPSSPLALGGEAWAPWRALGAREWGAVGLFIVLCMWFAAEYQVRPCPP